MATITLHRTLGGKKEIIKAEAGKRICDVIDGVSDWRNSVVFTNGKKDKPEHEIEDDDVIFVQITPSVTAMIVTAVVASAVCITSSVVAGVQAAKAKKAAQKAQKEARERSDRMRNAKRNTNLPFLKGSTNQFNNGNSLPVIFGRNCITPYLVQSPIYSLNGNSGDTQYMYQGFQISFGPCCINKINIDNTTVKDFGNPDFPQDESGKFNNSFFSDDDLYQISQPGYSDGKFSGTLGILNTKYSTSDIESNIPYDSEVGSGEKQYMKFMLPVGTMETEIGICFTGLYRMDDDGYQVAETAKVFAELSLDNGGSFVSTHYPLSNDRITQAFQAGYVRKGNLITDGYITAPNLDDLDAEKKRIFEQNPGTIIEWDNYEFYKDGILTSSYTMGYRVYTKEVLEEVEEIRGGDTITQFNMKAFTDIRYPIRIKFTDDQIRHFVDNNIQPMVRMRLQATKDTQRNNACYVKYHKSKIMDMKAYKATGEINPCPVVEDRERKLASCLAIRVKATETMVEMLKKVNLVVTGLARSWDSTTRTWSKELHPERNPAACALQILTSDFHPLSRFSDSEINLESFGEWYEWCQSGNRSAEGEIIPLTFDFVITEQASKMDTLQKCLDAAGATLYMGVDGKWAVAFEDRRDNPVALLNAQNVKSIQVSKDFGKIADAARIKFITSVDDQYLDDAILYFKDYPKIQSFDDMADPHLAVIKEISTQGGISTPQHAQWYARRFMWSESQSKSLKVSISREGVFFRPLEKVWLATDALKVSLGSGVIEQTIVENGRIARLKLNGEVEFPTDGRRLGLVVNHLIDDGAMPIGIPISGPAGEKTDEVLVDGYESYDIQPGEVYSYGYLTDEGGFERIISEYLITQITPTQDGCELELIDYLPNKYVDCPLEPYAPNFSDEPSFVKGEIKRPTAGEIQESVLGQIQNVINGDTRTQPPEKPAATAYADETGVALYISPMDKGLRNTINMVEWKYLKDFDPDIDYDIDAWINAGQTIHSEHSYMFDRMNDGYPEAEDFANWRFICRVRNIYNIWSEWSDPVQIDTSEYGTWNLQAPSVLTKVSDRCIMLTITQPPRADGRRVYGVIENRIQIKKPTQGVYDENGDEVSTDFDGQFWKPATSKNPYESEDNYKDGEGYVVANNSYNQVMPLIGQDSEDLQNTTYTFRVVAVNAKGESPETVVSETALCTSIRDIVIANQTAKEMIVSHLSAISASLGNITDGSLQGNELNYWNLSSLLDDSNMWRTGGAFRVGGTEQFIRVYPVNRWGEEIPSAMDNGASRPEVATYHLEFRAGDFSVSSNHTSFMNSFDIYDVNDKSKRLHMTSRGLMAQRLEGAETEDDWKNVLEDNIENVGLIAGDDNGDFFMTNVPSLRHDIGHHTPIKKGNTYVYPLASEYKDLEGVERPSVMVFNGSFDENSGCMLDFDGLRKVPTFNGTFRYNLHGGKMLAMQTKSKYVYNNYDKVILDMNPSYLTQRLKEDFIDNGPNTSFINAAKGTGAGLTFTYDARRRNNG